MNHSPSTSTRWPLAVRTVLTVGYLALAAAVLIAGTHRPTGYELSIFAATPLGFWLGVALAVGISLVVSVQVRPGWSRVVALSLGGLSVGAIAALPVLRGYYFYGTADALTHLGWARDMMTGVLSPAELFYPGLHSVAAVIATVTGISIESALPITVAALAVVAILFVPLAVRTVARGDRAVVIAAFAAFLLFFVHNLGVYLHAHSFAQATFFSALVLFLAFVYLERGSTRAVGGLLALASLAVVLYHPQQAANLILVFVAISLVQLYRRRYTPSHPIAGQRTAYAHTLVLIVAFLLWVTRFEGWAFANLARVQEAFLAYLAGRPPTAGGGFQSQAASLTAIGSGLPEIFLKLFLVAAIFSVLAGVLMVAAMMGRADRSRPSANAVATYLGVASLFAVPVIGAYFFGDIAEHYFRHIGFLLLIATIVGALALSRGLGRLSERFDPGVVTVLVVVFFAVLLPLSLATAFPSPFMHKHTQHVTEPQMDGHAAAFDVNDESLTLAGIRQGPWRYSDAIEGVEGRTYYDAVASDANVSHLSGYFADGGYLLVSEYDTQRELNAYRELRYTRAAFEGVRTDVGVNRVLSNGQVELYHVPEASG